MLKKHILLRTNIIICFFILLGFLITAVLSYQSNYNVASENVEKIAALTSEGIYYQLTTTFAKPVNVSLTMANDSLLKEYLLKETYNLENEDYVHTLKEYLNAYQNKYNYESVFLVSALTNRYYNFNGIDRVLDENNPENEWYYALLKSDVEYDMNVDNDEAANNEITVFVNCKIKDLTGNIIGIVGVGVRIDSLQELLREYENKFDVEAFLVDEKGFIEISTKYTGYDKKDLFELYHLGEIKDSVLEYKEESQGKSFWTAAGKEKKKENYVVARYIPELSWHLIVERNIGAILAQFEHTIRQNMIIICGVILIVLFVITYVVRAYNYQIFKLTSERGETFRKATEQLYDNIYELNITKNCAAGISTERYFESLGAPKGMPYDQALKVVAEKQIKEEFREGYINTFRPDNVLKQYQMGNKQLRYDFKYTQDGINYYWIRIDTYIFQNMEDDCIHMFTYRKNIDAEKNQEIKMTVLANRDGMTKLYNKVSTESMIEDMLAENTGTMYAFFIFDIDNFKQANDMFSHAFGDYAIIEFSNILKRHFRTEDLLGRIGGDEFAAFIPIPNLEWVEEKAEELSKAMNRICSNGSCSWKMSASIGIAIAPRDGESFDVLYKNADAALYQTKRSGKNGYTFFKMQYK